MTTGKAVIAMNEIWKPIPGYLDYKVSNFGRVKSLGRFVRGKHRGYFIEGRILKPIKNKGGYLKVNISVNGQRQEHKIHQLVMSAFVGDRPDGLQVNHIDEDKTNNRLDNLEYVTPKENINHGTHNARASKNLTGLKRSPESCKRIKNAVRRRARAVECIETGVVYETCGDAEMFIGITQGVRSVCHGRQKTAGGYHWRYVS